MSEQTVQTGLSDNAASGLAYITIIPAIVFLAVAPYNRNSLIRFHAWQSILLFLMASATDIVLGAIALLTVFLGTTAQAYSFRMLFLFWLVLWAACEISAFRGKRLKLPLIGRVVMRSPRVW